MPAAILAFDTTLDACSVALCSGTDTISEQRLEPRAHARILLPMIDSILARAALKLVDLDAIAFAQGPGSFTGVRMAASVAQGLAFGAQLPVIPISSLAILAQARVEDANEQLIVSVIDARMGEVYAGFYMAQDSLVVAQHADSLLTPAAVPELLAELFSGRPIQALGNGWPLLNTDDLHIEYRDPAAITSAEHMLALAEQAWQNAEALPAEQAMPVYLRGSSAWRKMSAAPRQAVID